MFTAFKNLFTRRNGNGSEAVVTAVNRPVPPASNPFTRNASLSTNQPACPPMPAGSATPSSSPFESGVLVVGLKGIVARLGAEFRGSVAQMPDESVTVNLPLQPILEQLAKGSVRVAFGDVRKNAPAGIFVDFAGYDPLLVEVPLPDVIAALGTACLPRRQDQRRVDVPAAVNSPFDTAGPNSANPVMSNYDWSPPPAAAPAAPVAPKPPVTAAPVAPVVATPAPVPPAPVTPPPTPANPTPHATAFFNKAALTPPIPTIVTKATPLAAVTPAPKPSPPVVPPAAPVARLATPVAPVVPRPAAPAPPVVPPPAPKAPPVTATVPPVTGSSVAVPVSAPAPAAVTAVATVAAAPAAEQRKPDTAFFAKENCLNLPVNRLNEGWPEAVLGEIKAAGWENVQVSLPLPNLEVALKLGRVAFTWKQLRSWMPSHPQAAAAVSGSDAVMLELPLRLIAPLFISQRPYQAPGRKVSVPDSIPSLFGSAAAPARPAAPVPTANARPVAPATAPAGAAPVAAPVSAPLVAPVPAAAKPAQVVGPVAAPAPAPAAATVEPSGHTTYFTRGDLQVQPVVATGPDTSFVTREAVDLGQLFGEPQRTTWTPTEVVRKVSTLKGVAGTLICTLDGLLVAAQFPTPVGEEAVAAMIPQVFGKLVTCSKELRFGTPSRMHFAVEGTQYQVFRTGRVYLTLASDPGEALPMPELMAVAEMLAKQSR